MSNETAAKPWGGRFSESTDAFVERFTASVSFDQRLALHDIRGSLAHAEMLARAGVTVVVEPGGSVRDDEVIAAANEHGIVLIFTGMRHFRH